MAYTFLSAQGISIGKSLLEKDKVAEAQSIVEKAYSKKVECLLPADHVCVREIKPDAETIITQAMAIPPDLIGVDIGPHSIEFFTEEISKAKTIFWNGPMGIFEIPAFAKGSIAVAEAMAQATKTGTVTIVGGGDSLAVLAKTGLAEQAIAPPAAAPASSLDKSFPDWRLWRPDSRNPVRFDIIKPSCSITSCCWCIVRPAF